MYVKTPTTIDNTFLTPLLKSHLSLYPFHGSRHLLPYPHSRAVLHSTPITSSAKYYPSFIYVETTTTIHDTCFTPLLIPISHDQSDWLLIDPGARPFKAPYSISIPHTGNRFLEG